MSKKIIILERTGEPSDLNFTVIFWLTIPATRKAFFAKESATSIYKDATPDEIKAIQEGTIQELVINVSYPSKTPLSEITSELTAKFNEQQINLNTYNPFVRYGTFWDGTNWTNQGVI